MDYRDDISDAPNGYPFEREESFLGDEFTEDDSDTSEWGMGDEFGYLSRPERLRLIAAGRMETGQYEGDEPWPFGSEPGETALDALARLAREYSESQADDRTLGPVELINMHEAIAAGRQDDEDSDMDDTMSDTDSSSSREGPAEYQDTRLLRIVRSSRAHPEPPRYIIAEDGAAMELRDDDPRNPNFAAVVEALQRARTVAASQNEHDGAETMNNFVSLMINLGIRRNTIADALRSLAPPVDDLMDQETSSEEDNLLDVAWDGIADLEYQLWLHRTRYQATLQDFTDACATFGESSADALARFGEHIENACMMTTYHARRVAIISWFAEIPAPVRQANSALLEYYGQEAALVRRIRSARFAAGNEPKDLPDDFVEHPHEMITLTDEYDVLGAEIYYGFEQYDDTPVTLYGAALFEAPQQAVESERVAQLIAGLAINRERAMRPDTDLLNGEMIIHRASVGHWLAGARTWIQANGQRWTHAEQQSVQAAYDDLSNLIDPQQVAQDLADYEAQEALDNSLGMIDIDDIGAFMADSAPHLL